MAPTAPFAELLAHLRKAERHLLHRHSIRLRVDKVTSDGRNALCSATEVRAWFNWSNRRKDQVVSLAHRAVQPLQALGLSPLISVIPVEQVGQFGPLENDDPFKLVHALHQAGMTDLMIQRTNSR